MIVLKTLVVVLLAGWLPSAQGAADSVVIEELGLRVARGFRVTVYADSDLANDIYAMTLDSKGRVVVTSQGYIKTLHDTDDDGKADQATLFATTQTGGMGLCFKGADLYFCGDGFLSVYHDADGDGKADGPSEKVLAAKPPEHGGHAMRIGPDGRLYFMGGNDAGFSAKQISLPTSPVRDPMAGALFRLLPDGKQIEVVAHGFRNPYDFDFNAQGDLFTYDSDVERDFFLPWYTPTRLFHAAIGGHHGWQMPGWIRSWNRSEFYLDAVDVLSPMGRGSPTGVTSYRHKQFPPRYQDGLFLCDWTFGRILFCSLQTQNSTYRAETEVFLEPVGTHGFAPTDICVAPDGALFVSIGGRKTRGAVYRIEYIGEDAGARPPPRDARARDGGELITLEAVLDTPQPLDAWSRERWIPAALKMGPQPFKSAVVNERLDSARRLRAIEIVTELFGGLETARAAVAARSRLPQVRARVAWSVGRVPCDDVAEVLLPLAQDSNSLVRRCALEALIEQGHLIEPAAVIRTLELNVGSLDKRIRQATALLASRLSEPEWRALWKQLGAAGPQARLTGALAALWRDSESPTRDATLERVLSVLENIRNDDLLLQSLRLCMIALGDYNLQKPSVEVYTGYELARPFSEKAELAARIRKAVHGFFPMFDWRVNVEAARLLAMLGDDNDEIVGRVANFFTEESSATSDFHFLTVLSRLNGKWTNDLPEKVAHTILDLERKLAGQEQRAKQTWTARLVEVTAKLVERDARVGEALLKHPAFAKPGHVELTSVLQPEQQAQAARLFQAAVEANPQFVWSPTLVRLLSTLPAEEIRILLLEQWNNLALRDAITVQLAKHPNPADQQRLLEALNSNLPESVRSALEALSQLPGVAEPNHAAPVLRLLRRLLAEPPQRLLRQQAVALLEKLGGEGASFRFTESASADAADLRRLYAPVFAWFARRHPQVADVLEDLGGEDAAKWSKLLKTIDWNTGDPSRGAAIFRQRACESCHTGTSALGPDLTGVASRFSPEDLFTAMVWPNRDVSPAYRTSTFQMRDGQTHAGSVAFESADGVILQTSATTTVRLADRDILSRQPSNVSLMPSGLLNGLEAAGLADLYAFLKGMNKGR